MSAQPIQAGITGVRPFGAIVAESGDKWTALPTPQKLEVLDGYLENRAVKDPAFGALDAQKRFQVKTGFIQKFILNQPDDVIGQQQPQEQPGNIGDFARGVLPGLATSGAYITQPFEQFFTGNTQRYDVAKTPDYQQNQAYRWGADVGSTAGNLAQYAVGALGGIPGVAAVAANQNIQRTAAGEQNAGQAVFNTALDTALAGLAPQAKSLLGAALKNAGIGAVAGAAGYAGNQAITGQPITAQGALDAAKRSGLEGGAIGAGFHFAHPARAQQPPPRRLQGRVLRQQVPVDRLSGGQTPRAQAAYQQRVSNEATAYIQLRDQGMNQQANALMNQLKPETQASVKAEVKAFDERNASQQSLNNARIQQAVKNISPQRQDSKGRPLPSDTSEALKAQLLERYRVTPEQRQQQGQQARVELENLRTQNRLKVEQARTQEVSKREKAKATPTNAKAELEAARQATIKARTERSQALLEISKAREEMRAAKQAKNPEAFKAAQSKHDKAQTRKAKAEKVLAEQPKPPEKEPPAKPEASASSEENRSSLEQAILQGKAVKMEHRAERAGTRDESTFRDKGDLPYEFGENEQGEFVRVINENGQVSMRYLDDIVGSVEITDERHPYTFDREGVYKAGAKKGQPGRFRVLDEDGNEVSQVKSNLTKDSELAGRLQKMEEVVKKAKSGKKPTAREILDASKGLEKESFKKALKDLPPEKVDEMGKDIGC